MSSYTAVTHSRTAPEPRSNQRPHPALGLKPSHTSSRQPGSESASLLDFFGGLFLRRGLRVKVPAVCSVWKQFSFSNTSMSFFSGNFTQICFLYVPNSVSKLKIGYFWFTETLSKLLRAILSLFRYEVEFFSFCERNLRPKLSNPSIFGKVY